MDLPAGRQDPGRILKNNKIYRNVRFAALPTGLSGRPISANAFCQEIMLFDVIVYSRFLEFFTFDKFIFMRQIKLLFVSASLALWSASSCSQSSTKSGDDKVKQSKDTTARAEVGHPLSTTDIRNLFTLSDAEKILGEPGHLVDSGSTVPGVATKYSVKDSVTPIKQEASSYNCTYEANTKDKKTGRTGLIYFLIEQYYRVSSASTVYSYYKRANENNSGFKELHDLGDEAWFGNSPLFVYVRKGDKILVMKVNKMTSLTSLDGFNLVVKHIVDAL